LRGPSAAIDIVIVVTLCHFISWSPSDFAVDTTQVHAERDPIGSD
jgi:hypothetical protein